VSGRSRYWWDRHGDRRLAATAAVQGHEDAFRGCARGRGNHRHGLSALFRLAAALRWFVGRVRPGHPDRSADYRRPTWSTTTG
jgi:hypothetical protein